MTETAEFDDIRPYNDAEVAPTLARLLKDNEFLDAVTRLKLATLGKFATPMLRPIVRAILQKETAGITTVTAFQQRLEKYVRRVVEGTTTDLTVSGLDRLDASQAYCFISNHRDIAMDPAFVNWVLYQRGFQTLRIAIGDNLLTKPFASDLMRLNKSFIVKRSVKAPREKLRVARKLSNYIHHSIVHDRANIWIAQREGRAKDGMDKTNPAIISMLSLGRAKSERLGDFIQRINIVPVAISYELDPCDEAKARELTLLNERGSYEKSQHEDVQSIAQGITGQKGCVHLAFGEPFGPELETVEQVVTSLDQAMLQNYLLHPSNCYAYEMLEKKKPKLSVTAQGICFHDYQNEERKRMFLARVEQCDPRWRNRLVRTYANPVYAKLASTPTPC